MRSVLLTRQGVLLRNRDTVCRASSPNALGFAECAGLEVFGEDEMHEGDVFIINDAATLGKHLNDVCAFTPIRISNKLLGFFAVLVHWVDVGGNTPGSCLSPTTTEIFQEGIQFPVLKLIDRGQRRREMFRLIEINTRFPRLVMGDLQKKGGGCLDGSRHGAGSRRSARI